jgi:hypothetical protein
VGLIIASALFGFLLGLILPSAPPPELAWAATGCPINGGNGSGKSWRDELSKPVAFFGCGCCANCKIFEDLFNRAGPGYGSDWNKESGTDPTIISNELDFSAPADLRCTTAHPDGAAGKAHAHAKIKLHSADDTIRLKAGWIDANNYVYVEVVYQISAPPSPPYTAGCSYLRVGYVEGGVDFPQSYVAIELTADVQHTLNLCWFPDYTTDVGVIVGYIELNGGGTFGESSASGSPEYGSYAAVEVTSGTAKVDDFYYGKAKGEGASSCPDCHTPCSVSSDNFTRADSADNAVGCKWWVRDGHQVILGNQWKITANNSRAEHVVVHPGYAGGGLIGYLKVKDVSGAKARLYIGCSYLEYSISGGGHSLSIYDSDCSGPTGTLVSGPVTDSDTPAGGMIQLRYCVGNFDGDSTRQATAIAPGLCVRGGVVSGAGVAFIGGDNNTILADFVIDKYKDAGAFPPDPDCDECECDPTPQPCITCCDPTPNGSYVLDFGGGGWSSMYCFDHRGGVPCDGLGGGGHPVCNYCSTIAGSFVLDAYFPCSWLFYQKWVCEEPFLCCIASAGNLHFDLYIYLQMVREDPDDSATCRWKATITLLPTDGSGSGDDCTSCDLDGGIAHRLTGYNVAIYYSDYLPDNMHCSDDPVTLTKFSETGDYPCRGALPATITKMNV